jgi:hypothetical protein
MLGARKLVVRWEAGPTDVRKGGPVLVAILAGTKVKGDTGGDIVGQ